LYETINNKRSCLF